jgi:putative membrane protein
MMSVDRQFVLTAAEAGLANIAMGELALQKSTSPQVKQFAQAEIAEQQQLKQALSQVAPRLGVSLPTAPGPRYQALAAKLAQLSGEQFNRAYLHEGGVNAHLENAATFQREAQFGQDAGVVAIANRSLPTIQNHFTTASQLTDYRFAQISQRFSTPTAPGTPQGNMSPRTPSAPVAPAAPAVQ